MGTVRILFLGDVFGKPGRRAVQRLLPKLISSETISFVIANCENIAEGAGVDAPGVEALLDSGVDVLTSGNHVWRRRGIEELLDRNERLLRPANYPVGSPGTGYGTFRSSDGVEIAVLNLIGRIFLDPVDCPFRLADEILREIPPGIPLIVDMHAEASSEKVAMGWHLAGRVAAVLGTHTHVQTADERILPGGTAYISDVGMCGPRDSVIGSSIEAAVDRFRSRIPRKMDVAAGPCLVQGALIDLDRDTGKALGIRRVQELVA